MVAVELGHVRVELLPDVVVPREEVLRVAPHQPDLPIAEGRPRPEGHVLSERVRGLLLEAGDPRRVDGHPGVDLIGFVRLGRFAARPVGFEFCFRI